jgi:hypothetical protein
LSELEIEYGRDAYATGDTIEGVIVATDRIKARDDGESALAFEWRVVAREKAAAAGSAAGGAHPGASVARPQAMLG